MIYGGFFFDVKQGKTPEITFTDTIYKFFSSKVVQEKIFEPKDVPMSYPNASYKI